MAYTLCNHFGEPKPIRLIVETNGQPEVKTAFTPYWWVCDPCNPHSKRYEVTYREGAEPQYFAWYQLVNSDDTERDIEVKLDHYKRVLAARKSLDDAKIEYMRLTGCGWSVVP